MVASVLPRCCASCFIELRGAVAMGPRGVASPTLDTPHIAQRRTPVCFACWLPKGPGNQLTSQQHRPAGQDWTRESLPHPLQKNGGWVPMVPLVVVSWRTTTVEQHHVTAVISAACCRAADTEQSYWLGSGDSNMLASAGLTALLVRMPVRLHILLPVSPGLACR